MPLLPNVLANPAVQARARELLDKAAMTAAEGALLAIGSESLQQDAFALDWSMIGGYALGGAFLSVVLNVARNGITGRGKQGV